MYIGVFKKVPNVVSEFSVIKGYKGNIHRLNSICCEQIIAKQIFNKISASFF